MFVDAFTRTNRLLYLAVLLIQGCGEVEPGPPIHPVSGTVFVDGVPATGAEVVFHPADKRQDASPQPVAVVDLDGGFKPSTRLARDGAPAGDYVLTVVWRKAAKLADDDGGGADQLRGRYGDPGKSLLKATVKAGDNVLPPIELNTKR